MAIRPIQQLKEGFRRRCYPTEQQFADWMDSYFHREEKIPITGIDGLAEQLLDKYPKADGEALGQTVGQLAEAFNNIPKPEADATFPCGISIVDNAAKNAKDVYLYINGIAQNGAFKTRAYIAVDVRAIAWLTNYNPAPPPPPSGQTQTTEIFRATVEVYCNCYPAESMGYGSGVMINGVQSGWGIEFIGSETFVRIKVGSFASHGGALSLSSVNGNVRLINEIIG